MLSGDPMNPTPESGWDFNWDQGGSVVAVTPLYVAKAAQIATEESVEYYDALADFIANSTAPGYHDLIASDGTHYEPAGYTLYGEGLATILNGLTGVTKVAILGDSLGNGITDALTLAYN